VTVPALLVVSAGTAAAQHHDVEPVGASSLGGVWLRLLTVAALVVVTGAALLRPFAGDPGRRGRGVVVSAAAVAVIGELALVPTRVERLDPRDVLLPVVLATGALAVLPLLSWARGRTAAWLSVVVGFVALVVGTDPAAVGELFAGEWAGSGLRSSALAWVSALAWFALGAQTGRVAGRAVGATAFVVAVVVVAAVPGFVAAGEHAVGARGAVRVALPDHPLHRVDFDELDRAARHPAPRCRVEEGARAGQVAGSRGGVGGGPMVQVGSGLPLRPTSARNFVEETLVKLPLLMQHAQAVRVRA
jgi:hypothetical protein